MGTFISVIVPIYKVEMYLRKCIDSLLSQTYSPLEIILVDDGSPDKCGEICDEYECKYKNIRVIHKENGGLSDARNAGIDKAIGEYIGFVDSDDWVHPEMYETLYDLLIKNDADISICRYQKVYDVSTDVFYPAKTKETVVYSSAEALWQLFEDNETIMTTVWNRLYNRKLFHNIRFPAGRNAEDVATAHRFYHTARRIVYTDAAFYYYVIRRDSLMSTRFRSFDTLTAMRERKEYFKKFGMPLLYDACSRRFLRLLIWYYVRIRTFYPDKESMRKLFNEFHNEYSKCHYGMGKKGKLMFLLFDMSPTLYTVLWKIALRWGIVIIEHG